MWTKAGAFSPERAGSIPNDALYRYGYDHDMTPDEMDHFLSKKTGLLSLLGTNDLTQLSQQYGEDAEVTRILDAMAYQVAKLIGELAVAFKGAPIDQIILTGGIANSDVITEGIRQYVEWIAPVSVYAGEMEMEALASGVFDVLEGTVEPKYYKWINSILNREESPFLWRLIVASAKEWAFIFYGLIF